MKDIFNMVFGAVFYVGWVGVIAGTYLWMAVIGWCLEEGWINKNQLARFIEATTFIDCKSEFTDNFD